MFQPLIYLRIASQEFHNPFTSVFNVIAQNSVWWNRVQCGQIGLDRLVFAALSFVNAAEMIADYCIVRELPRGKEILLLCCIRFSLPEHRPPQRVPIVTQPGDKRPRARLHI